MSTGPNNAAASSKAYIACNRCQQRKKKCDGALPKCAFCVSHGLDCEYAPVRRVRGLGKKNKSVPSNLAEDLQQRDIDPEQAKNATQRDDSAAVPGNFNPLIERLPPFLAPDSMREQLDILRDKINSPRSSSAYTGLIPPDITNRLVENSLQEVPPELLKIVPRPELLALFKGSSTDPEGDATVYALKNSIIAIAIRAKTVDTPTLPLSRVASGYYRHATGVLDQLLLGNPSVMTVRALLVMAMAAQAEMEGMAVSMLLMNAGRLLGFLQSQAQNTAYFDEGVLEQLSNVMIELSQNGAM